MYRLFKSKTTGVYNVMNHKHQASCRPDSVIVKRERGDNKTRVKETKKREKRER